MKTPVSRLNDPDMQAVPVALMWAAERARRLAEQTGTRFVWSGRPPACSTKGSTPPVEPNLTATGARH